MRIFLAAFSLASASLKRDFSIPQGEMMPMNRKPIRGVALEKVRSHLFPKRGESVSSQLPSIHSIASRLLLDSVFNPLAGIILAVTLQC